jgi:hypothetical protein
LSDGLPPHDGGLPDGHDAWHDVLEGPLLLAMVMQHTWPPLQSPPPMHGMEAAPLGHEAAVAAHVPCKLPPIPARQHTCEPGQMGQRLVRTSKPLLLPPASLRPPLLLAAPLLPVPLLLAVRPPLLAAPLLLAVPLLPAVPPLPKGPLLLAVPPLLNELPLLLPLPSKPPSSPEPFTPPQAAASATPIDAHPKICPRFMTSFSPVHRNNHTSDRSQRLRP